MTKKAAGLVQMSNAGALGTLLVEKFGGERGRCYPNQDSEFLIVFENEKGVPNHDAIAQTVEAYYTALGYKFEREQSSTALLPMLVLLPEDEEWGVFNIIISAPYPWNGGHASMRVTTSLVV
ncbi:MAG: hypothetical protein AAB447_01150 [Patescibacteria group bacterium]